MPRHIRTIVYTMSLIQALLIFASALSIFCKRKQTTASLKCYKRARRKLEAHFRRLEPNLFTATAIRIEKTMFTVPKSIGKDDKRVFIEKSETLRSMLKILKPYFAYSCSPSPLRPVQGRKIYRQILKMTRGTLMRLPYLEPERACELVANTFLDVVSIIRNSPSINDSIISLTDHTALTYGLSRDLGSDIRLSPLLASISKFVTRCGERVYGEIYETANTFAEFCLNAFSSIESLIMRVKSLEYAPEEEFHIKNLFIDALVRRLTGELQFVIRVTESKFKLSQCHDSLKKVILCCMLDDLIQAYLVTLQLAIGENRLVSISLKFENCMLRRPTCRYTVPHTAILENAILVFKNATDDLIAEDIDRRLVRRICASILEEKLRTIEKFRPVIYIACGHVLSLGRILRSDGIDTKNEVVFGKFIMNVDETRILWDTTKFPHINRKIKMMFQLILSFQRFINSPIANELMFYVLDAFDPGTGRMASIQKVQKISKIINLFRHSIHAFSIALSSSILDILCLLRANSSYMFALASTHHIYSMLYSVDFLLKSAKILLASLSCNEDGSVPSFISDLGNN